MDTKIPPILRAGFTSLQAEANSLEPDMRAGNYYGGKDFRVEDVADPLPAAGEILIRVTASGICGSDLHEFRNEYPAQTGRPPRIMGHELVGVIAGWEGDGRDDLKIGGRVGINPLVGCGHCERCRSGMSYLCFHGQTLGIHRPGGFAEYTTVAQENCYPLPDTVSDDAGATLDVYACALHGLTRLPVKPGDAVVVIGTGAMALAFAELAGLAGASPLVMVGRRKDAVEKVAALVNAVPVSSNHQDPLQVVRDLTHGQGADIVFECVGGTSQTLAAAMDMARQGGSIGVEGVHIVPQSINTVNALLRELTVTWFYSHGRRGERTEYAIALDLMARKRIRPERLVTHHFPLEQITEAFSTADDHARTGSIKVIVNPS
ncbi:MAG: zinc-dependent alcohol dehydrogenase [Acidobacteriaceae bacterium]